MGDISENFSRSEHACDCINQGKKKEDGYCGGEFRAVDIELNSCLEDIRSSLTMIRGEPIFIRITGPNRCHKHNTDIGGARHSYHTLGMGVDFSAFDCHSGDRIKPRIIYDRIDLLYPEKYGLKEYHNRVHFDVRPIKWRSPL